MKTTVRYICRHPRTPEELLEMLRLRRRIFTESGSGIFLAEAGAAYGLDVDWHDLYATHIGLYQCEDHGHRLVGTMRAVGRVETDTAAWIRDFSGEMPGLEQVLAFPPPGPLPMMDYLPFPEHIRALDKICAERGKTLFEISRFAVEPAQRSLLVFQGMIETVIAFVQGRPGSMVFTCSSRQRAMYQPYLNWPVVLTPVFHYKGIDRAIVFWDFSLLPAPMHPKILLAVRQYQNTKELHFHAGVKTAAPSPDPGDGQ